MNSSCKIVMYHYVRPLKFTSFPKIKGLEKENFIRQIEFFKKKFKFITANDILDGIYENKTISSNSILLTFDDGFKDHYNHVFPILKKYDIQGLFFPPGKPIIEKMVLDVHKIHHILAKANDLNSLINEIFVFINENKKKFKLKEPEEYFKDLAIANRFDSKEIIFIKRIIQRELPEKTRGLLVNKLFKKFVTKNEMGFSEQLYLNKDEIDEMRENGMFFGSHGYSHQWLSHMSEQNLNEELGKSLEFYDRINPNGKKIMCYPYGDYNESVVTKIKKMNLEKLFLLLTKKKKKLMRQIKLKVNFLPTCHMN